MKKSRKLLIIGLTLLLLLSGVSTAILYSLDAQKETNTVIIGYNEIEVDEDFTPPPELKQGDNLYKKAVRVKNTGNTDAYVRVFTAFSSKEIEDVSMVSGDDGNTYSPLNEYVPSNGWVKSNDSYYYYDKPIAPGEYTPYLFTNVKTTFENSEDIQQYEILVYAESVQIYNIDGEIPNGFNYEAAWKEFLERKDTSASSTQGG